jgi:hypothetical protein
LVTLEDPVRARTLLDQSAGIAAEVGNREAFSLAQSLLGELLDHLSAARMRLTLAEQSFASGDRFWARNNLFGVAQNLNNVGDHDAAHIIGAWVLRQALSGGFDVGRGRVSWADFETDEFLQSVRNEFGRLEPLVAGMTDMDVRALARDRIRHHELLAGITVRDTVERGDPGSTS